MNRLKKIKDDLERLTGVDRAIKIGLAEPELHVVGLAVKFHPLLQVGTHVAP